MEDRRDPDDVWQNELMVAVQDIAAELRRKHKTNPWPDNSVLEYAMVYLMTELWDKGFDSPDIDASLREALRQLSGYAAGER